MYKPLTTQTSFSSLETKLLDKSKTHEFLETVNQIIDWNKVEKILAQLYCENNGRAGHNPLIVFKGLLLEQWYQLSDAGVEEELKDRLSFRAFVGLKGGENPPDETTFVRFRTKLTKDSLDKQLFEFITDELRKNNKDIKQGKSILTDASLICQRRELPQQKSTPNGIVASNRKCTRKGR